MPDRRYKTNVYVDAFNLYYGCLKDSPYKWLNLASFCQNALPHNEVNRIRYFTARVQHRPNDLQKPERQNAYLRALQTLPGLSVHFGHYLENVVRARLANPSPGQPLTVKILKTEEKGSDVNLATFLLTDAFDRGFEAAVIISNDSDLRQPIRVVRQKFRLPVVILHPCRPPRTPSIALRRVASKSLTISEPSLAASQFPATINDPRGTIHKPSVW